MFLMKLDLFLIMPAQVNDEVKLHFTGFLENGEMFDTSEGKDPLKLKIGSEEIIPGFNKGLEGMEVGEERQIQIPPALAYGSYHDDLIWEVSRDSLEGAAKVGDVVAGKVEGEELTGKIIEIEDEDVLVDFNHPLAGQTLTFDVKLLEISGRNS